MKKCCNLIFSNKNYSFYSFIFFLTINISINALFNKYEIYKIVYHFTNITLRIKGNGNKQIFGSMFNKNNYPNKVYINGLMQDVVNYTYLFNKSDNYVELFWEHNKINCDNMFR